MTATSQVGHAPVHESAWPPRARPIEVSYVLETVPARSARPFHSRGSSAAVTRPGWRDDGRVRGMIELMELAHFEAICGRADRCRQYVREASVVGLQENGLAFALVRGATLGLLELGLGNPASAAEEFEQCRNLSAAIGANPAASTFEADFAEALVALGRHDEALAATRRQYDVAQRLYTPRALAAAARCRGLVAEACAFEPPFEAALALHELLPGDFERARTELCYGERLRRARRRGDCREHLAAALGTFERMDTRPWAVRAERELDAATVHAEQRGDPTMRDRLTAQEMRVAMIVAQGATVRETAAQLFLSTKTIEAHLGRAYRKLGVRNRAELVVALSKGPGC